MAITLKLLDLSGPLPTATYDIYDDDKRVGMCQLRHRPGKPETLPDGFESHVYYEIEEEFRGMGYAKEALKLLLSGARNVGLSNVVLTVAEDNVPSQRVIEGYGAQFIESGNDIEGVIHRKYRIDLQRKGI